jgi:6-phosphogluconolactonase/glucosamine-6-phosphate isomerase/deaminase
MMAVSASRCVQSPDIISEGQATLMRENVVTFNMDEYVGIPRDHPESYHTFMFKNLFSLIDIE